MDEIRILDPEFDGRRLVSRISVPRELRKYVLSSSMFVARAIIHLTVLDNIGVKKRVWG